MLLPAPLKGKTTIPIGNLLLGQVTNQMVSIPIGEFLNFCLLNVTTANANDSIKITGQEAALSVSNPAFAALRSTVTAGRKLIHQVTDDVTINLTGAHWGAGAKGDITGAILRVYAINDAGTLKFGVGYVGGRESVSDTSASITGASVVSPEMLLVNSALTAGTWPCIEIGYFYANFDDTGGAAEDLWAVQTGTSQLVTGKSPDGIWQPYNGTFGGFDTGQPLPTWTTLMWTQHGKTITVRGDRNANGTSNATTFTFTLPVTAKAVFNGYQSRIQDNGAASLGDATCRTVAASVTLNLYKTNSLGAWTNVNGKSSSFNITYEANL